jgi:uncharacterized membrane protein
VIKPPLNMLNLQKRSKVLGLPMGRKTTDWTKVAMLGAGAASTLVSGVGAARRALKSHSSDASDETTKNEGAGGKDSGDGSSGGRNVQKLRMIIRETIEVAVPKTVAYNQWTQFADLPSIVKGVKAVDQEEDDLVQWTAKIGPSRRTWKAEITEQVPDEKIAWESKEGPENRGVISFHELDNNLTLVAVEMEYFPSGPVEKFGNLFLMARRRVRKDLRLFKHYIELAGEETGAWRGEIPAEDDDADEDIDLRDEDREEARS